MKAKFLKKVGSMSSAVMISRVLGLLRDVIFTAFFGVSYLADAFNYAYRIPNFLRLLFGEGALAAAFIPLYGEVEEKKGRLAQVRFGLSLLTLLSIILLVFSCAGIVFAPFLVKIIAPGLSQQTADLTITLTQIMMPYLFLIGTASMLIAILNYHDYFFWPALSAAFFNLGTIFVIGGFVFWLGGSSQQKVVAYSWGIVFGGVLQLLVNLPFLKKVGYRLKLVWSRDYLDKVWQRFLPGLFGVGVRQLNIYIDLFLASFLAVGSASSLSYSYRLMQLALGVLGVPIWAASLPVFSKLVAQKDRQELQKTFSYVLVLSAFLMIPVTALMISLGREYITILFARGVFDQKAVEMTYSPFFFYVLALTFFCFNHILVSVFYAHGDTKSPVKVSAVALLANIGLNLWFMRYFGVAGLALASLCSAVLQCAILFCWIKIRYKFLQFPLVEICKILVCGLVVWWFVDFCNCGFSFGEGFAALAGKFLLLGVFGVLLFVGLAYAAQVQELKRVLQRLGRRR